MSSRLLPAAALLVMTLPVAAASRGFDFEVLLDDKPIGSHVFTVEGQPEGAQTVRSKASFDVRVLGVRLYRYRHEAEESWQGGCLERIKASTDDNGTEVQVRGARSDGAFMLELPRNSPTRAGCISAFAYWDPQRLLQQSELLNPQTGKFDAVRIESLGEESIQSRGTSVAARRYRLVGEELQIDLWYSADGQWLQLESPARGKRRLLYRLR